MSSCKFQGPELERRDLDRRIFVMRRDGALLSEIAKTVNMTVGAVSKRLKRYIDKVEIHNQETIAQIKKMSDARLLNVILHMSQIMRDANTAESARIKAAMAIIAADARRSALLGLDAVNRLDVTVTAGERRDIDAELEQLLAVKQANIVVDGIGLDRQIPASLETASEKQSTPATNGNPLAHLDVVRWQGGREN